jgi:hypothetical protein
VNVLMSFEMELGRETLPTLRADNGANLQVNSPNVPLHQTGAGLEATLIPTCVVPDTLGFSTTNPLDVIVGVDSCRGAGGGRRLRRLILGGKCGRGRGRSMRGTSSGMRVVGEIATVTGTRGWWVGVGRG